jgi:hypothetical protein
MAIFARQAPGFESIAPLQLSMRRFMYTHKTFAKTSVVYTDGNYAHMRLARGLLLTLSDIWETIRAMPSCHGGWCSETHAAPPRMYVMPRPALFVGGAREQTR